MLINVQTAWIDSTFIISKINKIDNKINVAVNCRLSAYQNISYQKSHLLVLLFIKLLPVLQFTNASKQNTFNSRWIPEKNFQLDSNTHFTWGVMKDFQKFLLTIMNNLLNFFWNFNAKWTLHSVIGKANMAEFEVREDCF